VPALNRQRLKDRQSLEAQTRVADAPVGTVILRKGEESDAAYFIIKSHAVAGLDETGGFRLLEVMQPGDFFGEIDALNQVPRTANVIADGATTLLQIPADRLKELIQGAVFHQLFTDKMTMRLNRTAISTADRPRLASLDQQALRKLRTNATEDA